MWAAAAIPGSPPDFFIEQTALLPEHLRLMTVLMLGKQLELGHYRAEFLQYYGIRVIFPESKKAAMVAIDAGGFDAVILSYTLSDETAKELVARIRQASPECPFIAITKQDWDSNDFQPDETVLHSEKPQALVDALTRVGALRQQTGIRRVK